jgi:glutamine synthetase
MIPSPSQDILSRIEAGTCQFVELQFTDVTGTLKSVVLPAHQLTEALRHGHWFDGSALEGDARSMETDLLLRPDVTTGALLPWSAAGGQRTGRFLCDIQTPEEVAYAADPRGVLRRLVQDASDLGFQYQVAAEVEFFLFQRRQVAGASGGAATQPHQLTAMPASRGGYLDLTPEHDTQVRNEIVLALESLGVCVTASHHEISPGQHELDLPLLPALQAADAIVTCKYAVKAVARRHGLAATFMPKPLADAAGSGLHLAQVLSRAYDPNALAGPVDEYGLSSTGRAFVAGQLAHARAMCAVLAPSVNSYKRLGRGFDAPSRIMWSHTHPFAAVRVPRVPNRRGSAATPWARAVVGAGGEATALHVELRCPDSSCNPYLALAVALAAGLDGIRTNAELPAPAEALAMSFLNESQVEVLPASLGEALQELEWDPVVRDALGAAVYERLLVACEREWQAYRRQISAWELDHYFERA